MGDVVRLDDYRPGRGTAGQIGTSPAVAQPTTNPVTSTFTINGKPMVGTWVYGGQRTS